MNFLHTIASAAGVDDDKNKAEVLANLCTINQLLAILLGTHGYNVLVQVTT
jgi:hypothetical protein